MYLLDTNVVSELRKSGSLRIDKRVSAWAETMSATSLFLSAITILEIETGLLRLERKDKTQAALLRVWFEDRLLPAFSERILSFDIEVARACANLHVPDPKSDRDAMIAATAKVYGMVMVTRNEKDFDGVGIQLINPWKFES